MIASLRFNPADLGAVVMRTPDFQPDKVYHAVTHSRGAGYYDVHIYADYDRTELLHLEHNVKLAEPRIHLERKVKI